MDSWIKAKLSPGSDLAEGKAEFMETGREVTLVIMVKAAFRADNKDAVTAISKLFNEVCSLSALTFV